MNTDTPETTLNPESPATNFSSIPNSGEIVQEVTTSVETTPQTAVMDGQNGRSLPEALPDALPDVPSDGSTDTIASTTGDMPVSTEPKPSYVKLAMRNMVKKRGLSLYHFFLTTIALLGFLVGLSYLTR